MTSQAKTVSEYLAELPPDRRAAIQAVREVILKNLDKGYEEGMSYGMIGYYVPHRLYPAGYHCDPKQPLGFAGLGSQKNHMAIYMMCIYGSREHEAWFRKEWAKSGKKLDMGKSCIRFRKIEDLPLEVIGQAIARVPVAAYIRAYESVIRPMVQRGAKAGKTGAKKSVSKKTIAKKARLRTSAKKSAGQKTRSSRKTGAGKK